MYYIVIRTYRDQDNPALSELVRTSYIGNVFNTWINALFNELTFQVIILVSAIMFICFGVPLTYCVVSIPLVLIMMYIIIYGSQLMKAAEVLYNRKPLACFLAEAYEPFLFPKDPKTIWYKLLMENELVGEGIDGRNFQKTVIGTVAVMRHFAREDWAWMFRLVVDKRYRRKGLGLKLVETAKSWCRQNQYNNLELAMSECQEGARELFNDAGFGIKQLYHKKLFAGAVTLQMFQLKCEVRQTF